MTTTIQISDEVWETLNKRKKKGESFEDVLKKLLKINNLSSNTAKSNTQNTSTSDNSEVLSSRNDGSVSKSKEDGK